jgi:hypothetical protein
MGMMVLQQTIEERTFTNLYHSFAERHERQVPADCG